MYIVESIDLNSSSITPWFKMTLLDSYLTKDTLGEDISYFWERYLR